MFAVGCLDWEWSEAHMNRTLDNGPAIMGDPSAERERGNNKTQNAKKQKKS